MTAFPDFILDELREVARECREKPPRTLDIGFTALGQSWLPEEPAEPCYKHEFDVLPQGFPGACEKCGCYHQRTRDCI